jgi:hypothetical protein
MTYYHRANRAGAGSSHPRGVTGIPPASVKGLTRVFAGLALFPYAAFLLGKTGRTAQKGRPPAHRRGDAKV